MEFPSFFFYNMGMKKILVGKITKPFGVRGEVKVYCYTDFPKERFRQGSRIYLQENDEQGKEIVSSRSGSDNFWLLKLEGCQSMDDAEKLRDIELYKDEDDIPPLPKGEYYFRDLEGLSVYSEGVLKGTVVKVEEGVTSNYLRVRKEDGSESLVPFLPVFIEKVDLEEKKIHIQEIEGLL